MITPSGIPPAQWQRVEDRIACPVCGGTLAAAAEALTCEGCRALYPVRDGILDLRPADITAKPEFQDWTTHWSAENQRTLAQRFFSVYRKSVFARTVAHFVNGYFPRSGVFLEAGSGTSETSHLIRKYDGARVLIAADIIVPVLRGCHPIMDLRAGADIFRLPFRAGSLDGIWNVGVMEHFLHDQIDRIMAEFHRVLKPGGVVILLWPATDSLPQKGLRLVERVVNSWKKQEVLKFHPDEISQLRSSEEGREVLRRNQFEVETIDWGLWSLMAFKVPVGKKSLGPAHVHPPALAAEGALHQGDKGW
jgi:SAM-dependent methyltransferase